MEHVETLVSKSARKQMEQSKNNYKPSRIVWKMFVDLFLGACGLLIELKVESKYKTDDFIKLESAGRECELGRVIEN